MARNKPNQDTLATGISEVRELEEKKKNMLRDLLDDKLINPGRLMAVRGHMGQTDSYVATATFRWISNNVRLFTELPLFQKKIDENGRFIIDEEIIEELRQRAPHWSRQQALTYYLIQQRHRIFPPLLVVVSATWVDEKPSEEFWDKDGRAKQASVPLEALDSAGRVVLLDLVNGITCYVIDGGHRLLGVKAVVELVTTGSVDFKTGVVKHRDDLLQELGLTPDALQGIDDEAIGIEFVPAVLAGETRDEARIRIRSMFVHTNKTAQPPSAGEQVMLDEDDGFSIIARRVALRHDLFRKNKAGDRVGWRSSSLPKGAPQLTVATTLREMSLRYLEGKVPYNTWKVGRREIPLRPDDGDLDSGLAEVMELMNWVAKLPVFVALKGGDPIDKWREFGSAKKDPGCGHLLTRPLGQAILAETVGLLHNDVNGPRLSLDVLFDKLARYDAEHGF